jgi:hypothetical protein
MIDFPDSPALNSVFTSSGRSWKWDGVAWRSYAPPLAAVATSGDYADLSNRPTLATVATSGSYTDLTDKPTLGTTIDLDKMFSTAVATYYHAHNYSVDGDLNSIQVFNDSGLLFTRVFTYDGNGNLTTIVTEDEQNIGVSLTKTFTYTGSGDIATVARNYNI